jgi:MFS family permease
MEKIISPERQKTLRRVVFISNLFLSFQYSLVIYVNSSFLGDFFSDTGMSVIYIVSSFLNILVLLLLPRIINKLTNYRLTLYFLIINAVSITGLIVTKIPFLIGLYFIISHAVTLLIFVNIDLFLESTTASENTTGNIRSINMTISNSTTIIATIALAAILSTAVYSRVYLFSLIFTLPLFYLVKKYFKEIREKPATHIKISETISKYLADKNLYGIFISRFLLQFFYGFMTIYTPIYLSKNIGFSWTEIGLIFTIMLLPFVLLEIPVGNFADKKYGEKEFLTVGFVIMGIFTLIMSFITAKNFILWAVILFITRIGASLVEVSSDVYFFRKVNETKTNLIGLYRITAPLSFIAAPLIIAIATKFIPLEYSFLLIGAIMIIGTHYSLSLKDTK